MPLRQKSTSHFDLAFYSAHHELGSEIATSLSCFLPVLVVLKKMRHRNNVRIIVAYMEGSDICYQMNLLTMALTQAAMQQNTLQ